MYQSTERPDDTVELRHAIAFQLLFNFFVAFTNSDGVLVGALDIERRTGVSLTQQSSENETQVKIIVQISQSLGQKSHHAQRFE